MVLVRKEIPRLERKEERYERLKEKWGTSFIWCKKREQQIAVMVCNEHHLSPCFRKRKKCEAFEKYWEG